MSGGERMHSTALDIQFQPTLELVSLIRRFVVRMSQISALDPDTASRLEIATHEILENAVKHAQASSTRIQVEFRSQDGGPRITIRTWNRARARDVEELQKTVREMEASGDPHSYYLARLESAVQRTEATGLGLARVWAEAGVLARATIEEGQLIVTTELV